MANGVSQRVVNCSKLGQEAPGLDKPPFGGELGQLIYEKVSAQAWSEWQDGMMIKIINEYRLNMADPEHYSALLEQMKAFLRLDDAGTNSRAVLEVENAARGKGD